jgi:hypothetical protein
VALATQERTGGALYTALVERFAKQSDGYWYPVQRGTPLVRISESEDGIYQIHRRRTPNSDWFILARGLVGDFDAESFGTWADSWDLVAR